MIGSINAYTATQAGSTPAPADVKASSASENQNAANPQASSTQTISTLARQLADSANRAEARDKTLSRSELGDKARSLLSQISGDSYQAGKEKHDSEVPSTSDPVLLARAKQATEFVNRSSNSGSEKNPFAGLSREQLANVIYDDSGAYTVNERRAAWMESSKQEEVWREKVIAQAIAEYNQSGKLTNFFSSVLDHFKGLPAIEQAQYPKDYASDLEAKISRDFNYRTNQAEGKGEDPKSLIEMLLSSMPEVAAQKQATNPGVAKTASEKASSSPQTISTLARQLADSASRAEARDKTLSRSELGDKAKVFLSEFTAEANPAIQAKHDSEVPNTNDPELQSRAKQATAFLVSRRNGSGGVTNPFAGLSREQLANITYDDSGVYTFNERAAAFTETERQEYEWGVKVAAQAMDEYNRTGKLTNFFSSVLDHFKGLPAIEQAQYPKDYASDLEAKISRDFNYRTNQAEGKGEDPKSLIEMLFSSRPEVATQKAATNPGVAKQPDSLPPTAQSTKTSAIS